MFCCFCSLKYFGLTVLVMLLALMIQLITGNLPSFSAGFTTRVQSRILLWLTVAGELMLLETTRLEAIGTLTNSLMYRFSTYLNLITYTGSVQATLFHTSGRAATRFSMAPGATTELRELTCSTTPQS